MHSMIRTVSALAAAAALPAMAPAQSQSQTDADKTKSGQSQQSTQRQNQNQSQNQDQSQNQTWSQNQDQRSDTWSQQNQDWNEQNQDWNQQSGQLEPQSTMVIGYDLDGDGRTDAWYQVTRYEFDRMNRDRMMSQGRPMQGRVYGQPYQGSSRSDGYGNDPRMQWDQRAMQQRQWQQDDMQRRQASQWSQGQQPSQWSQGQQSSQWAQGQQQQQLSGELTKLDKVSFADGQKHLVGKIKTQEGREIPVYLGSESDRSSELRKGERVTVVGHTGKLNDRKIIVADRVSTQNNQFDIRQARTMNLKRCDGTIKAIERVSSPQGDEQLLARVQMKDGSTEIVALGTRSSLSDGGINLSEGEKISLLGQRTQIQGRPVLLVSRIYADNRSVAVSTSPDQLTPANGFGRSYQTLQAAVPEE